MPWPRPAVARDYSGGMPPRSTAVVVALGITALPLLGCGGESDPGTGAERSADQGPIHVHGLGINPKDGALFIATHTGLFRAGPGESGSRRVADRYQDTMGFTVVGPDRFLGSGHPDLREELPPFLGLIRSADAGESWRPISLQGRADFHVLEARGSRVYGFGTDFRTREEQFLVSVDGGRSWEDRRHPESLISLAVAPDDPDVLIASGARDMHRSDDGGRSWVPVDASPAHLAWPVADRLYAADVSDGAVRVSTDGGERWRDIGSIGGRPAAFEAASADVLYAALHDGTITRSADGGDSWAVRSRPDA